MVQQQVDAFGLDFRPGPVGEISPVGHFAAEEKRQAADAEIGISIRHHHRDGHVGPEFPGPQRGADARVVAADDEKTVAHVASRAGKVRRIGKRIGTVRRRTATPFMVGASLRGIPETAETPARDFRRKKLPRSGSGKANRCMAIRRRVRRFFARRGSAGPPPGGTRGFFGPPGRPPASAADSPKAPPHRDWPSRRPGGN